MTELEDILAALESIKTECQHLQARVEYMIFRVSEAQYKLQLLEDTQTEEEK